jgi:hypothetical protein
MIGIESMFDEVSRMPFEKVWLHKHKPHWIVFYEKTHAPSFYQAYRAVEPVKNGRDPWSVNNKRIGDARYGYATLREAMEAAA